MTRARRSLIGSQLPVLLISALIASALLTLSACGGGDSDSSDDGNGKALSRGTIAGQVLSSDDLKPVANAQVSLRGAGSAIAATTRTGADGRFQFDALPAQDSQVVYISAEGYVDGLVTESTLTNQRHHVSARLVHSAAPVNVDFTDAVIANAPNSTASIELAAGTVAPITTSAAVSGTAQIGLTAIDTAADAQSLPGTYLDDHGQPFESFGGIDIQASNAAGRLDLIRDQPATVHIPVATRWPSPRAA